MRTRRFLIAVSAFAVAVGLTVPVGAAHANDGSEVTGDRYSNVGGIILTLNEDIGSEGTFQRYAGGVTLISPTKILTAQHVATRITQLMAIGLIDHMSVTFVNDMHGSFPKVRGYGFPTWISPTDLLPLDPSPALLPGYREAANPAFNDAAIYTLASPSTITPVALPSATLDGAALQAAPELTSVGYGGSFMWDTGQSRTQPGNPKVWTYDSKKREATVWYQSLTSYFVAVNANEQSRVGGGLCIGDSGAPLFSDQGGDGRQVQIALVVWGDWNCRAITFAQRLDLPEVREWIEAQVAE